VDIGAVFHPRAHMYIKFWILRLRLYLKVLVSLFISYPWNVSKTALWNCFGQNSENVVWSSKTFITTYKTTWCHNLEDQNLVKEPLPTHPPLINDSKLHLCECEVSFIAYFPKMKVGLSDHQSVCLSVCPPIITSELLGRFSWNLVRSQCHSRGPRCNNF
jgi:hypothetical protein